MAHAFYPTVSSFWFSPHCRLKSPTIAHAAIWEFDTSAAELIKDGQVQTAINGQPIGLLIETDGSVSLTITGDFRLNNGDFFWVRGFYPFRLVINGNSTTEAGSTLSAAADLRFGNGGGGDGGEPQLDGCFGPRISTAATGGTGGAGGEVSPGRSVNSEAGNAGSADEGGGLRFS
jgi:hypothetical protein|tara:strand:+ start:410 stop:934 length:525 start_codon:yes stop_codon:yes gene_type:complete